MIDDITKLSPFPMSFEICDALMAAYMTPGRAYHTLEHVLDVARHFSRVKWVRPKETFGAVLFHDAIYVVGAKDNEAQSAELAVEVLRKLDAARVRELILLTSRHGHLSPSDVDPEAALFLDCDMAILGSSPTDFKRYEQQIAEEYVPVIGEQAYREGRLKFLKSLFDRERIFLSDDFHMRFDSSARRNLRSALP